MMKDLKQSWYDELEYRKDIMSESRVTWMRNLFRDDPVDVEKARTISGYLMALRDCGRDIGDLKWILEQIIAYLEY